MSDVRWTPYRVTAPTVEPLSVEEAKAHLRITGTEEDNYVLGLIRTVREQAEVYLGKRLLVQTWDFYAEQFGCEIDLARIGGFPFSLVASNGTTLTSPITYIKYNDTSGVQQTLSTSYYRVDSVRGRITEAYGYAWPAVRCESNAVVVRAVLGYSNLASGIPATIKQGMLLRIGTLNEHREEVIAGTIISELPDGANSLWDAERSGYGLVA